MTELVTGWVTATYNTMAVIRLGIHQIWQGLHQNRKGAKLAKKASIKAAK